jgi:hypothetical protein
MFITDKIHAVDTLNIVLPSNSCQSTETSAHYKHSAYLRPLEAELDCLHHAGNPDDIHIIYWLHTCGYQ